MTRISVGNFAEGANIAMIAALFVKYGDVTAVRIRRHRRRTYAIVEMTHDSDAETAIRQLDGKDWHGQRLEVDELT